MATQADRKKVSAHPTMRKLRRANRAVAHAQARLEIGVAGRVDVIKQARGEQVTLQQIADELGVTSGRVNQLLNMEKKRVDRAAHKRRMRALAARLREEEATADAA